MVANHYRRTCATFRLRFNVSRPQVICLMGPTAAGKTAMAAELVERFPCEIISVDSAMIYRGMDIGTAKPDDSLLVRAPHHLLDIRDAWERYSVGEFYEDATQLIEVILAKGRVPLLVGGTMMYFNSLHNGLAALPVADEAIREKLNIQANEYGWAYLHQRLQGCDPMAAERIHVNDPQRLLRALEVYEITGKPLSTLQKDKTVSPYNSINIIVSPIERDCLHQRIATRFKQMLNDGLIDEVRQFYLLDRMNASLPSMRSVGYRQVWQFLDGEFSQQDLSNRGIIATRQLAKRQLTWLRHWSDAYWVDSSQFSASLKLIVEYLNKKL